MSELVLWMIKLNKSRFTTKVELRGSALPLEGEDEPPVLSLCEQKYR